MSNIHALGFPGDLLPLILPFYSSQQWSTKSKNWYVAKKNVALLIDINDVWNQFLCFCWSIALRLTKIRIRAGMNMRSVVWIFYSGNEISSRCWGPRLNHPVMNNFIQEARDSYRLMTRHQDENAIWIFPSFLCRNKKKTTARMQLLSVLVFTTALISFLFSVALSSPVPFVLDNKRSLERLREIESRKEKRICGMSIICRPYVSTSR